MRTTESYKIAHQNRINNAQGALIEKEITRACEYYKIQKIADIEKTPEPLKIIKKLKSGTIVAKPTKDKAQSDYKGILSTGETIIFEAKSTMKDSISRRVLTKKQMEVLENYQQLGAQSFVLVALRHDFYMIPWLVWREMKIIFGKQSLKNEDLSEFKVPYKRGIMFLHHITKIINERV